MNGKKKEFDEELLDTGFVVLRKEDIMSQAQRADLKAILYANDQATYLSLLDGMNKWPHRNPYVMTRRPEEGENHPCCQ